MPSSSRGAALVDVIFVCGLVAVIGAIAVPAFHATRDRDAARMAAKYLATRMHMARLEALKRNREAALRFDPTDVGRVGTFVDGDGDGVLQRDIDAGLDPPLASSAQLSDYFGEVALQIAADVPDPDGGGILAAGSDPIRLGSSNLLSFSPLGGATSGSIYLASPAGPQMCVRVFGATGRLRVLQFDSRARQWRQD